MSEKAMGEIESAIKIADLRSVIGKLPDGFAGPTRREWIARFRRRRVMRPFCWTKLFGVLNVRCRC